MLIWGLSSDWVALFWIQTAGQFILDPSWCLLRLSQQLFTRSASTQSSDKACTLPLTCICHSSKRKKKSNWFCFLFPFLLVSSICLAAQHRHNEWKSKGSTGGGRPRAHHRLLLHGWLQHHQHGRPGHRREGWSLLQAEGQVHEWAEQNSMWVCLSFLQSGSGTTWELKHQVYFI